MDHNRASVSLFTGAGGMDIGFQRAGFDVVWANELKTHTAKTYENNNPKGIMHCGDLKEWIDSLPKAGSVFCVFGGPPCQGFSVAGKMDISDVRSQLVFSYMDVVQRLHPAVFVMENVKALASLSKFSHVRENLIKRAAHIGYNAHFYILNARYFGVAQSRERTFLIGFRRELGIDFNYARFEPYKENSSTVRDILNSIGPLHPESNPQTCNARITLAERPVLRKSPYAGMMFNGLGRPLNTDGVSCTLPASMGGNKTPIIDEDHVFKGEPSWIEWYHTRLMNGEAPLGMYDAPSSLRRLTLKEAIAIQSFPPEYEFVGPISSQYTQIGNAVPCKLAYVVAKAVIDAFSQKPLIRIKGQQQLTLA